MQPNFKDILRYWSQKRWYFIILSVLNLISWIAMKFMEELILEIIIERSGVLIFIVDYPIVIFGPLFVIIIIVGWLTLKKDTRTLRLELLEPFKPLLNELKDIVPKILTSWQLLVKEAKGYDLKSYTEYFKDYEFYKENKKELGEKRIIFSILSPSGTNPRLTELEDNNIEWKEFTTKAKELGHKINNIELIEKLSLYLKFLDWMGNAEIYYFLRDKYSNKIPLRSETISEFSRKTPLGLCNGITSYIDEIIEGKRNMK